MIPAFAMMLVGKVAEVIASFWGIASYSFDGSFSGSDIRKGWQFTLSETKVCNSLRAESPYTTGNHNVIIHRNSDGAVIASGAVNVTSIGTWFALTVPSYTLEAGVYYTISNRCAGDWTRRTGNTKTLSALVTKGSEVYGYGDGRPTSGFGDGYMGCDFGYN